MPCAIHWRLSRCEKRRHPLGRHGTDMGGVIEEIVMPVVGHDDPDRRAIPTDAVQFLHDLEVDARVAAEMLQDVRQQDLADRVVRPGPGDDLEVMPQVGLSVAIDVEVALDDGSCHNRD